MLELDGLRRRFGEVVALDGLSFSVPPGKVVGFLGPNGAGKTTAMRAIFGVTSLDAGEVRWQGSPVGPEARKGFGYMPEERGLYPAMGVGEHLVYLARLHGCTAAGAVDSAARWAGKLGLGERLESKVESLSLGNQQRVQLAAALVHDPDLLVLDEPFSGLDPVGVDAMSDVLAERAGAGARVIFSSHQLDLVEHICDAVAIVHRGRLVAEGSVEELARGGRPRLVVAVGGDPAGGWARDLGALGGQVEVSGISGGRVTLALGPGADPQAVLALARAAGPVEHFAFERRRLSEVFREAVGAHPAEVEAAAGAGGAPPAEVRA
ncbi:MAG: ABC transporter ATP-binding protein [Acidimicrobiales bacterium]